MPLIRPRRNRKNATVRALLQEIRLHQDDFVYPLFVVEGEGGREPLAHLPDIYRHTIHSLLLEIEECLALGLKSFALFPIIASSEKGPRGSRALDSQGVLLRAIRAIKAAFPETCLITDVALDPYTDHGHDGLVDSAGQVLNDETVEVLIQMALLHAEAGIDMVAPSDMMDGRIGAIRTALESQGFIHTNIVSYAAKYASCFYGPFREALSSQLAFGDKRSYQLNPANIREALLEAALDEREGADILLIKPALPYLDVIAQVRSESALPIAAYQVSGEYAMLFAAEKNGFLNADAALYETLLCIKRAGADLIFTYGAKRMARKLAQNAL